ncbi:GNAT family N-acetyltransferase [Roseospira visakhapatnamensis]|uniref:Putative N-acetyltransferase YhbS n=1 Tax=Roseospira visakhapatnamensis TaxID=390880 RepID=A0A7W6RCG4_9PROT|nr:N-acetyltransferase [Roseospira visakhapatnamensis]MBB4265882.1 putative N-acetyltransferase YhbS [Roseospira visakhapatnamensis]
MPLDPVASPLPASPAAVPYALRPHDAADAPAVEALLDRAFGADRHAKRSYAYRQGVEPVAALGFVATRPDGTVIGTLRFWPIQVGDAGGPALLLGPIAVEPALKGLGIGKALMRKGLFEAQRHGHGLVVLVGDLSYYGVFGFRPAAGFGLVMPHERPHRVLALPLTPNAAPLGGTLRPASGPDRAPPARGDRDHAG